MTARRLRPIVLAVVAVLGLAVFVVPRVLAAAAPHLYAGTVLQGSEAAPDFDGLADSGGRPVDPADHAGEILLVYFGYTACPDVCPTMLAEVARARALLDPSTAAAVNLVMVTVDPERDDPAYLQNYVEHFDATFRSASGSADATRRVASRYGVIYELHDDDDGDGQYSVDHTATMLGVGPDGALRIVWAPDVTAEALAADLDALLD